VPIAEANGQRLYYEVHGEGEPLLCVMGLSADHTAWVLNMHEWAKSRRVIVFDNRDVGQSSYVEEPYEVTDLAADAIALADHLGLEDFDLIGLSMGGAIAQEIALAAPERVRTLTLCVTYPAGGEWGKQRARVMGELFAAMTREQRVEFLMMAIYSEQLFANPSFVDAARQAMLANPHPQPPEAFRRQVEASSRHDARERVGELAMPVHVIGARRDMLVPFRGSEELAELIPGAKFTRIDSGHAVNVEAAQEFNAAVMDFIAEKSGAPA
jgi:3-oxoadipate enol-lactonase